MERLSKREGGREGAAFPNPGPVPAGVWDPRDPRGGPSAAPPPPLSLALFTISAVHKALKYLAEMNVQDQSGRLSCLRPGAADPALVRVCTPVCT